MRVAGDFGAGATVAVRTLAGATVATGATNYAADDLRAVAGSRSSRCAALRPNHPREHGVVVDKRNMTLS